MSPSSQCSFASALLVPRKQGLVVECALSGVLSRRMLCEHSNGTRCTGTLGFYAISATPQARPGVALVRPLTPRVLQSPVVQQNLDVVLCAIPCILGIVVDKQVRADLAADVAFWARRAALRPVVAKVHSGEHAREVPLKPPQRLVTYCNLPRGHDVQLVLRLQPLQRLQRSCVGAAESKHEQPNDFTWAQSFVARAAAEVAR